MSQPNTLTPGHYTRARETSSLGSGMVLTFLTSLLAGMLLVLSTASFSQIAWRFLRLVGALALALACVVLFWRLWQPAAAASSCPQWTVALLVLCALAAAGLVLFAPFAERHPRRVRGVTFLAGLAAFAALLTPTIAPAAQLRAERALAALTAASQLLGTFLLGSITVAWLLGHAYLTATKMTLAPLRHFSRMLSWAVAVRFAFLPLGIAAACFATRADAVTVRSLLVGSWLILLLRVAMGLAGVAVFAYMVADCVRLRATQSATGILYFGSVFAYVGELAGQHLSAELGWPM